MISKGIKFFFYNIYKIALIGNNQESSAMIATVFVSAFWGINLISITILAIKIFSIKYDFNLTTALVIGAISLIYCSILFIFKSRYKDFVSHFEKREKGIVYAIIYVLFYILIILGLFALVLKV